ncbi:transcriptional regulator [Tomitella fengzijianii]|uniref:helix-turn-helix transcriptional regulator n=1 Tax=Tomitella fengzijianii TaxID=2597660 RepID=UPI00131BC11C|nr:PAS domain-containing protein [Tomitella fengzijianii]
MTEAINPQDPPQVPIGRTMDGERLITLFTGFVEVLGRALPAGSEAVLHDLSKIPNSIIAIHGSLSGRSVGNTAGAVFVEKLTEIVDGQVVTFESTLADGRWVRSSTMIIRDIADTPVAALCINTDVSMWQQIDRVVQSMLGFTSGVTHGVVPDAEAPQGSADVAHLEAPPGRRGTDMFTADIDELSQLMIRREIETAGVPVALMKKAHKVEVVRGLQARGIFQVKNAVEQVAEELEVTRFTIYNYLKEINGEG